MKLFKNGFFNNKNGQSTAETIMIVPILGVVVYGIFFAGQIYYKKIAAQNVAYSESIAMYRTQGTNNTILSVYFDENASIAANSISGIGSDGQTNAAIYSTESFSTVGSDASYQWGGLNIIIDIGQFDEVFHSYQTSGDSNFIQGQVPSMFAPYMECFGVRCDTQ